MEKRFSLLVPGDKIVLACTATARLRVRYGLARPRYRLGLKLETYTSSVRSVYLIKNFFLLLDLLAFINE